MNCIYIIFLIIIIRGGNTRKKYIAISFWNFINICIIYIADVKKSTFSHSSHRTWYNVAVKLVAKTRTSERTQLRRWARQFMTPLSLTAFNCAVIEINEKACGRPWYLPRWIKVETRDVPQRRRRTLFSCDMQCRQRLPEQGFWMRHKFSFDRNIAIIFELTFPSCNESQIY